MQLNQRRATLAALAPLAVALTAAARADPHARGRATDALLGAAAVVPTAVARHITAGLGVSIHAITARSPHSWT